MQDIDAAQPRVTVKRLSQQDSPSRGLVAEMMILAGEAIGALGALCTLCHCDMSWHACLQPCDNGPKLSEPTLQPKTLHVGCLTMTILDVRPEPY